MGVGVSRYCPFAVGGAGLAGQLGEMCGRPAWHWPY
jgi:hypothetical protein